MHSVKFAFSYTVKTGHTTAMVDTQCHRVYARRLAHTFTGLTFSTLFLIEDHSEKGKP